MCKADREVRPIFFNKTHYLHCTKYAILTVKEGIPDKKKLPHEALHQRDLPVIFAYSDCLSLCRTSCGSPFNQLYHFARKRKA